MPVPLSTRQGERQHKVWSQKKKVTIPGCDRSDGLQSWTKGSNYGGHGAAGGPLGAKHYVKDCWQHSTDAVHTTLYGTGKLWPGEDSTNFSKNSGTVEDAR